jgi:DNA modification methylase
MNHLYYGDNLSIMRTMPKNAVDLIYLDPPFNSKQNYNLIYKNLVGLPVPDQADAFCDTWEMDAQKEEIAKAMPMLMREHGVEDYYVEFWRLWINALRHTQPHLLAYLIYMVQRLLHMKSILRPTGSIYLHCDPTASHYIKVMMDGIFGHKNFRNEIIWKRTPFGGSSKARAQQLPRNHDVILFYSASDKRVWHGPTVPYTEAYLKRFKWKDERGSYRKTLLKTYSKETFERLKEEDRLVFPKKAGAMYSYKQYLHESKGRTQVDDVWTDINMLNPVSKERLGYPTQKPIALLERIIAASSNPGDVIFDPFCGCGTTIYAAEKLKREWIGCDIAILSIKLMREILQSKKYKLVEDTHFDVRGIPVSVEQAEELFKRDPFQFEHWLVERIGGFPTKKTGDKGIDGRIYFETHGGLRSIVLSVKGGKLRPTDVRDLRGVLADEKDTEMAGFLSLQEPTKAMREAASLAGQYEYKGVQYDRIQFLTVKDILEDRREFHSPTKMGSRIATGQQSFAY